MLADVFFPTLRYVPYNTCSVADFRGSASLGYVGASTVPCSTLRYAQYFTGYSRDLGGFYAAPRLRLGGLKSADCHAVVFKHASNSLRTGTVLYGTGQPEAVPLPYRSTGT